MYDNLTPVDIWLLANVMRGYRPDRARLRHASADAAKLCLFLDDINVHDRDITLQQMLPGYYKRVQAVGPDDPYPLRHDPSGNWHIIHASELEHLKPVRWLIEGVLPESGFVVIYGSSGAGKSFVALDYALKLAQGMNVVYVAAEGEWGYRARVGAWVEHHKLGVGSLYVCLGAVNLYETDDFNAFVDGLRLHSPKLVVVDTLAMCSTGADENNARDMGRIVKACKYLQHTFACAVLVVHHTNKGGVAERGSGALRGAADVMMKVSAHDDLIVVEPSKTKDTALPPSRYVRLLPVGESVVVVEAEKIVSTNTDRLTTNQVRVLEVLSMDIFRAGAALTDILDVSELGRGSALRVLSRLMTLGYVSKLNSSTYAATSNGLLKMGVAPDSPDSHDSDSDNGKSAKTTESTESTESQAKNDVFETESVTESESESTQLTWDEMRRPQTNYDRGY